MKNVSRRRMKLGFNIVANGAHVAGWRMPGAKANAAMDIRLWKDMARAAERARIHFMFWADGIAVRHSAKDDDELSFNPRIDVFEPLTVIGALAAGWGAALIKRPGNDVLAVRPQPTLVGADLEDVANQLIRRFAH